ncbi:HEAT repeat protein [Gemmata sp. SH-PL17]|uniref:HEAT repeat domain-containing protein n=1 Tax=Gemmata sp. SH-PL17 TaxID=1630693 RepID=UPI00078D82A7|nr:HEAT repeat domain-containing protein [Gemmata sp. SH-PL17]AMV27966.1 HEAT repeat protein [Gemmata sp. SH-PL17]
MSWSTSAPRRDLGLLGWVTSCALLLLPCTVLAFLGYRTHMVPLYVGAGVQGMFVLTFLRAHPVWRPPVSASLIILYLIALAWLWLPTRGSPDWTVHIGQSVLLLTAVALAAVHDLIRTGAEPLRRANKWCGRLVVRKRWPIQLTDCRALPEVVALRAAVLDEVRPVLALLTDPRPEVQCAALGALEYRPQWQPGEAELVLKTAHESPEPAVRAAAAYAMAGVGSADLIAGLAGLLRDPVAEVRFAASEAILWNADARWPFAREGVREALADPRLANDGPLFASGRLPGAAFADLITWAEEHAPLAPRAILTLIEQFHRDLTDGQRPELASQLAAMMLDTGAAPSLRVELAALLRDHNLLSVDLLDRLTNMDQPGPIRLFAAEQMLRINPHDPDGVDVLRGLARQPNREMALSVAGILQNVLGLELGLPPGELPPTNSKLAADVTRRVLLWANGANPDQIRPTPGPMAGLKGAPRSALAGVRAPSIPPPKPPAPPESHELPHTRGGSSAVF